MKSGMQLGNLFLNPLEYQENNMWKAEWSVAKYSQKRVSTGTLTQVCTMNPPPALFMLIEGSSCDADVVDAEFSSRSKSHNLTPR